MLLDMDSFEPTGQYESNVSCVILCIGSNIIPIRSFRLSGHKVDIAIFSASIVNLLPILHLGILGYLFILIIML